MSLFSCKNITRNYQNEPVVKDINISLDKGQLVSLVGASGVGKTTLFNILAGVDRPDEGKVMLGNEDITQKAGKVGYMLQKDLLLPYKTIIDNVSLPLLLKGVAKSEARATAAEHMEEFGLMGYEKKYPHQLSGGMRQRAALLRTFLMGSSVTLLDEPFSALDTITKGQMHSWYLDIVAKTQMTTLFITHDIDEAVFLSDKIYILAGKPGEIREEILIDVTKPRDKSFMLSVEFLDYKKKILENL